MSRLPVTLVRICLFQDGPQDMPANGTVLVVLVAIGWAASTLLVGQLIEEGSAALEVSLATAFGLLFTWLALTMRGGSNRFLQTASALFGTDLVLLLPVTPLLLMTQNGDGGGNLQLLLLLLWIWSIAIKGHIFRHALDLPVAGGVLVAIGYTILSLFITGA
ncbi:hypothetical protein HC341_15470 [Aquisalimonas sp. 2447]|uniref:hypothetical protein n=1 Tax=Aquisalimonas sp. 2447 TaxID=2740807 RepID=UPI0014326E87|nr:hypothetical protein [Aquisalimonas sp. 2447]QIT56473.1 hypothetical protein HC341_15470 [Aquisalimonas sp. 2447]